MFKYTRAFVAFAFITVLLASAASTTLGKTGEYEAVANHLKTRYAAKKVSIPFMWLAKAAVKIVRPAGVRSFNITLFEDLKFSKESLDKEMRSLMRTSFGPEWSPILNVRSRDGEQVYMYMREEGKNIKIALVTIDGKDAALIKATFSPEKLVDFINNPKIFGISLDDKDNRQKNVPITKDPGN